MSAAPRDAQRGAGRSFGARPMTTGRTVSIVIDNEAFLRAAMWWLEVTGLRVCRFSHALAGLAALTRWTSSLRPEGWWLDAHLPQLSGSEPRDRVRQDKVELPVVDMTAPGQVPTAVKAMQKGALAVIEKLFLCGSTLDAALGPASFRRPGAAAEPRPRRAPAAGLARSARHFAGSRETDGDHACGQRLASLTVREREFIKRVFEGKLDKVIAGLLGISLKTMACHRKNATAKWQARSVIELTRLLARQGAARP